MGRKIEFNLSINQMHITVKENDGSNCVEQVLPMDKGHGENEIRVGECVAFINRKMNEQRLNPELKPKKSRDQPDGHGGC